MHFYPYLFYLTQLCKWILLFRMEFVNHLARALFLLFCAFAKSVLFQSICTICWKKYVCFCSQETRIRFRIRFFCFGKFCTVEGVFVWHHFADIFGYFRDFTLHSVETWFLHGKVVFFDSFLALSKSLKCKRRVFLYFRERILPWRNFCTLSSWNFYWKPKPTWRVLLFNNDKTKWIFPNFLRTKF